MNNLDDFKVEELEQRLELRKWSSEPVDDGMVSGGPGVTF